MSFRLSVRVRHGSYFLFLSLRLYSITVVGVEEYFFGHRDLECELMAMSGSLVDYCVCFFHDRSNEKLEGGISWLLAQQVADLLVINLITTILHRSSIAFDLSRRRWK